MSKTLFYALDANVFIEAAKRYYAFDIAPLFWSAILHHVSIGRMVSIDRVRQEIERGNDPLADWVKNHCQHAFVSTSETDIVAAYKS